MDAYEKNKEAILNINQEISALIQQAETALAGNTSGFKQWKQSCKIIDRHLRDHVVRIAVVGAIKSGKSTLVNALLSDDYLKRGAGVVTSIVTRIRQGDQLQARLFFKSWDKVNEDIQHALVLFPSDEWRSERLDFDIRRNQDRLDLEKALETLDHESRIYQDQLNANGVLLSSYLKGYDQVESYISADSSTREFDSERFADHRDFVGSDALAVYLKDVQLAVPGDILKGDIELADCQGSDSPNPLHLAMIQDYLLKAHLIIYVVSSRTGLRQADIRFLSMIKRMGIAENMLYVCNCDLNEHDTLADLQALIRRLHEELSLVVDSPDIYAFSALFNLFDRFRSELKPLEKERLKQWRKAKELVDFSSRETARLEAALDHKLSRQRWSLLLQNQLAHIDVTANGLKQWVQLHRDLFRRDAGEARSMAEKLHVHQLHMLQVQSMIQSTLNGAVRKVSQELKKEVDRFLDSSSGPVTKMATGFVREYNVDLVHYQEQLASSGFTHTLYLVFQDLKQAVDAYMTEKVNPDIIGYIHKIEMRLQEQLHMIGEPYEAMVTDALERFQEVLLQMGIDATPVKRDLQSFGNLEAVKQMSGIALPPAAATMRYSAYIKTEAIMRLGFYSVARLIRKVLNRSATSNSSEELKALKDGIRRMKSETERSIVAHFKDYRENVKFQYIQRLAEMAGNQLNEILTEQFGAYVGDLKSLVNTVANQHDNKERTDKALESIESAITTIQMKLERVRREVTTLIDDQATHSN